MTRPATLYTPGTQHVDLTAPGGIDALLNFHRATFGDARMNANAGEGGDGQDSPGDGQDAAADDSGTQDTSDSSSDAQADTNITAEDAGADGAQSVDQLPDWAQKIVRDTRAEAANHRTKAKTAADTAAKAARDDLTKTLGKALGLIKDDEPADPAELTKQIEAERQAATTARIELAVHRAAGKHGGDPDALLDSRAFANKIAKLDPAADDFASQVDEAIKAAVENTPKLRVAQAAAGKAGGDFSAGNNDPGKGQLTREQLAKLSPAERLKAAREGRVANLLGSK